MDVRRQGEEEKVEGRLVGVTYHIVYHIQKFQSVPVILETGVGELKSKRLCADRDEAMVTSATLWLLYESFGGVCLS